MSDQWQPQPSDGNMPQPLPKPKSRKTNEKMYAIVGGVIAVVVGAVAVISGAIAFGGTSDAFEITDVPIPAPVFQAIDTEGPDPFFPLNDQLKSFAQQTGETPDAQAVASGLYGGTAQNTCDPQRLIDFLMSNPDKGRAWAQVQGITFEQIPDYINSLAVQVLAESAVVLNYGFDAETGEPYEIETTLDAGTAVLVDSNDDIRTRCYCGNPTKPKLAGHKPPRCVVMPSLVYTAPAGDDVVANAARDVVLTGQATTDGAWTEVSWGVGEAGWTPTTNLGKYVCSGTMPPVVPPTGPTPTLPPVDLTPGPTPTSPPPTPTTPPGVIPPTSTPVPPTPTPPPPTATVEVVPLPQPFQPICSISNKNLQVGESTEISGAHVPDAVSVTWSFDHGDGTIDPRNPSVAFYNEPGSYTVTGLADLGGGEVRQVPCGTVTVTGGPDTVQIFCSIDNTQIRAGGQTVFRASSDPHDLSITYVFDHGDGYRETANPSFAAYPNPGTYAVTVDALYQGSTITVQCGTVEVFAETRPVSCSADGLVGLSEAQASATAQGRGCSVFVAIRGDDVFFRTQDYRTDRVNLDVNHSGIVTRAVIG